MREIGTAARPNIRIAGRRRTKDAQFVVLLEPTPFVDVAPGADDLHWDGADRFVHLQYRLNVREVRDVAQDLGGMLARNRFAEMLWRQKFYQRNRQERRFASVRGADATKGFRSEKPRLPPAAGDEREMGLLIIFVIKGCAGATWIDYAYRGH